MKLKIKNAIANGVNIDDLLSELYLNENNEYIISILKFTIKELAISNKELNIKKIFDLYEKNEFIKKRNEYIPHLREMFEIGLSINNKDIIKFSLEEMRNNREFNYIERIVEKNNISLILDTIEKEIDVHNLLDFIAYNEKIELFSDLLKNNFYIAEEIQKYYEVNFPDKKELVLSILKSKIDSENISENKKETKKNKI